MVRHAIIGAIVLCAGASLAADKAAAGTDGTATAYDQDKKVLLVEPCTKLESGEWDYTGCVHDLREKVVDLLCNKKGKGTYKWSFQVGSEKSTLSQNTTCK